MAENKTKVTTASTSDFIDGLADAQRRSDCKKVAKLMQKATGAKPKMWGPSIVGFGSYHYTYESGRSGDGPIVGFSPRAQALTLYLTGAVQGGDKLLGSLGKFKNGKGCLYIKRLEEVDETVLEQLVTRSVEYVRKTNPRRSEAERRPLRARQATSRLSLLNA